MNSIAIYTRSALRLVVGSALLALLVGCDNLTDIEGGEQSSLRIAEVVSANAGAFGDNTSSLTTIDPENETASTTPSFSSAIQSHVVTNNRIFVAFEEEAAIGIFDLETKEEVGRIEDIEHPRYMITDGFTLYATRYNPDAETPNPEVVVVNVSERTVTERIPLELPPQGLTVIGNSLFIATSGINEDGEHVTQIPIIERGFYDREGTINPDCEGGRALFTSRQERLVLACSGATLYNDEGEVVEETNGALLTINPLTAVAEDVENVPGQLTSAADRQRAFFDGFNQELYVTLEGNTVVRYTLPRSENGQDVPSETTQIPVDGPPIGALAYDPINDRLYLGRPDTNNPFDEPGAITVHDREGAQLQSYEAGVAPGHIVLSAEEEE